ncbi:MAG: tyrosine-protein kinase [Actinomycetota bacterium]|jgi:receptor protein-tyrosine kinase
MELRRYLAVLRRRVLILTLTVAAGVAAGYLNTPRAATYSAEATIYVGSKQLGTADQARVSQDAVLGLERVIKTFASMIDSKPIAEAALQRVDVQRSAAGVVAATQALPVTDTQLLRIRVTDQEPAVARDLANGIADAFVEKIESFEPSRQPAAGELPQLPAYVFEHAGLPTVPMATGLLRRMILGGLFGFVLAASAIFLLEYLDVTVKTPADLERKLELPVLGVIPFESPAGQRIGTRAPPPAVQV